MAHAQNSARQTGPAQVSPCSRLGTPLRVLVTTDPIRLKRVQVMVLSYANLAFRLAAGITGLREVRVEKSFGWKATRSEDAFGWCRIADGQYQSGFYA
jgi:hypothetical protein